MERKEEGIQPARDKGSYFPKDGEQMCRRQYRHRKAMRVPKQTTGVLPPDAKRMGNRHGAPQSHEK